MNKILIVDDDKDIREVLRIHLEIVGYKVNEAEDGQEALDSMENEIPDVVLLDVMMPGIDGFEVCRQLRNTQQNTLSYIIMLTARDKTIDKVSALDIGADDYMTKPFDAEELLARIRLGFRTVKDRHNMMIDQLTQIHNRRAFDIFLKQEIARSKRYQKPFSLILVDIDHFKRINDNHGHLVGDSVLVLMAKLLKEYCRESDCICRWGGEEFIILLPELEENLVNKVAERIREAVEKYKFPVDWQVTISLGVATFNNYQQKDFVEQADKALYQAKEQGRNRVIISKNE
ncbi:diguanylate cyclase [Candidatus Parabeggiatoa sp. HSG14]|uniref:diguanylate cyclase n=1 Tax=Candidatus Parabeggiatoa sp. HSG14 TaxID=3055593 RepID=UPI0025A744D4|nr:diguanylate cyclase [Thiotrichales bacterium HSG14]